ncbi:MAG: YgaP family membrane protein [Gammaproteobacteria bacterium]
MTVGRMVLAFAGTIILLSLLLAVLWSHYWLWLTAFVGANLLQSAFTGFCPIARLFKKLGARSGEAFN